MVFRSPLIGKKEFSLKKDLIIKHYRLQGKTTEAPITIK